jgi:hypothetical protein
MRWLSAIMLLLPQFFSTLSPLATAVVRDLLITMHANFLLISAALLLFCGCNFRARTDSDKKTRTTKGSV